MSYCAEGEPLARAWRDAWANDPEDEDRISEDTLRAGKAWREPRLWYRCAVALARPFAPWPRGTKPARSLQGRGAAA